MTLFSDCLAAMVFRNALTLTNPKYLSLCPTARHRTGPFSLGDRRLAGIGARSPAGASARAMLDKIGRRRWRTCAARRTLLVRKRCARSRPGFSEGLGVRRVHAGLSRRASARASCSRMCGSPTSARAESRSARHRNASQAITMAQSRKAPTTGSRPSPFTSSSQGIRTCNRLVVRSRSLVLLLVAGTVLCPAGRANSLLLKSFLSRIDVMSASS